MSTLRLYWSYHVLLISNAFKSGHFLNTAVLKWHLSISIYTKTTLNRYKRGRWDIEEGELLDFESIPLDALVVDLGDFLKQPIW